MKKYLKESILIAIVILIVLFIRFNFLNNKKLIFKKLHSLKLNEKIQEKNEGEKKNNISNIMAFDNNLVIVNNNSVLFYNAQMKKIAEINISDGIDVIKGQDIIYIVNYDNNIVKSYNLDGKLVNEIKEDDNIFNIKNIDNKTYIHLKNENKDREILKYNLITDKNSKNNDDYESLEVKSEKLGTYFYDELSNKMLYSTLTTEDKKITSKVIIKDKNGSKEIKKLKNEIVICLYNSKNNDSIIVTDENIYCLDKNFKNKFIKKISEISDIKVLNNKFYILYDNTLEILNIAGEIEEKIELENKYSKILEYDNDILIYGKRNLLYLDKNGKKLSEYMLGDIIKDIDINNKIIAILTSSEVGVYKISN